MDSRLLQMLMQRQQQQQVNYPMPLVGPSSFPSDQMNYSPYAPYTGQG
jgi:hypothetical protein